MCRFLHASIAYFWWFISGIMFALCGDQSALPTATIEKVPQPKATGIVTLVSPTQSPISNTPQSLSTTTSIFAALEQGATLEDYPILCSAVAPVTLVLYSDFL